LKLHSQRKRKGRANGLSSFYVYNFLNNTKLFIEINERGRENKREYEYSYYILKALSG
jgi:hypothetical protein